MIERIADNFEDFLKIQINLFSRLYPRYSAYYSKFSRSYSSIPRFNSIKIDQKDLSTVLPLFPQNAAYKARYRLPHELFYCYSFFSAFAASATASFDTIRNLRSLIRFCPSLQIHSKPDYPSSQRQCTDLIQHVQSATASPDRSFYQLQKPTLLSEDIQLFLPDPFP